MITLCSPDTTSFCGSTVRGSGDSILSACGQAVVWIALIMRMDRALLDRIPFNNRFCAWRFCGSAHINNTRLKCYLFVVLLCVLTDRSSFGAEDEFHKVVWLLGRVRPSDVVVVASDVKVQLGYLAYADGDSEDHLSAPPDQTDIGDGFIQARSNYKLFLANTSFCHEK